MAAYDIYHQHVRTALEKDGWLITHEPFTFKVGVRQLLIDLGAEKLIAAQKDKQRIAVEIKSFLASSPLSEFHTALGQFLNYRSALKRFEPQRVLYLAVPIDIYLTFFAEELTQMSIQDYNIKIVVFNAAEEVIVEWKN
ncbi:MAG: fatty-acid oxidation protein subunit alpha [Symploca sp. SIO1C2]|nr:fatty-acid oxidation protein subunit alpha [Symploca sp. SIO1C2]